MTSIDQLYPSLFAQSINLQRKIALCGSLSNRLNRSRSRAAVDRPVSAMINWPQCRSSLCWLVVGEKPLWKIWVRQLRDDNRNPRLMGKCQIDGNQTTKQLWYSNHGLVGSLTSKLFSTGVIIQLVELNMKKHFRHSPLRGWSTPKNSLTLEMVQERP